jgi:hypothetical protein
MDTREEAHAIEPKALDSKKLRIGTQLFLWLTRRQRSLAVTSVEKCCLTRMALDPNGTMTRMALEQFK